MQQNQPIIFFDGVCNLCNGFVQFVINRDPKAIFKFASLQSEEAALYLKDSGYDLEKLATVVLLENGKIYTKSTAALRILKGLSGGWPLLYAAQVIPSFFRNKIYDLIAANRYKWFGKNDSCMLPTAELKSRFL